MLRRQSRIAPAHARLTIKKKLCQQFCPQKPSYAAAEACLCCSWSVSARQMFGKVRACASQDEAAYIGKALERAAAHLSTSVEHATSQHSNTPLHSPAKLVAIPQQCPSQLRTAANG